MNVRYHPLAEQDIDQVFDHYQEILPSLAEEFLEELNKCVENIVDRPLRYRCVRGQTA